MDSAGRITVAEYLQDNDKRALTLFVSTEKPFGFALSDSPWVTQGHDRGSRQSLCSVVGIINLNARS